MRVIERLYLGGVLKHERSLIVDSEEDAVDGMALDMIENYADEMRAQPCMIELEFPDEPESERFMRFGTDPHRMVMPIEVKL